MTKDVPQETQTEEAQPKAEDKVEKAEDKPEDSSEEPSAIEKGQAILDGIKEQNEKLEALTKRNEDVAARMMLGGKAEAGVPIKSPEEEAKEKTDVEIKEAIDRFN